MARRFTYDDWMEAQDIPIHRGYYVEDLRTAELGWWEDRQVDAAFMQLRGMEGVVEGRIEEIPPGHSLPPLKLSVDEQVYVLGGRGVATVWTDDSRPKKTFEWATRSLFLVPRNSYCQLTNMDGNNPARLLHYNYLPIAMSATPDPEFFFNNPYSTSSFLHSTDEFYSEAKAIMEEGEGAFAGRGRQVWHGNFFPDMAAWDRLVPFWGRGAGGRVVFIQSPGSEMHAHMSVFPARTYKKGHRHGPGASSSSPAARATPSCGRKARRKSSSTGTRRAASCPRTAGSTSTSTSAGPTGATWRSIRRTSSWACPRRCRTGRATRSSTRTRTRGYASTSRTSWPSAA